MCQLLQQPTFWDCLAGRSTFSTDQYLLSLLIVTMAISAGRRCNGEQIVQRVTGIWSWYSPQVMHWDAWKVDISNSIGRLHMCGKQFNDILACSKKNPKFSTNQLKYWESKFDLSSFRETGFYCHWFQDFFYAFGQFWDG